MTNFPEGPSNHRKEAILQRSPFLRIFLDKTSQRLNPRRWQTDFLDHARAISDEVGRKWGKNWERLALDTHVLSLAALGVFRQEIHNQTRRGLVGSLVTIGYEIGEGKDVRLFLPDLAARLGPQDLDVINPMFLIDHDKGGMVVDSLMGLMIIGVYLKQGSTDEATSSEKDKSTDPFNRFIEGLDLTGI